MPAYKIKEYKPPKIKKQFILSKKCNNPFYLIEQLVKNKITHVKLKCKSTSSFINNCKHFGIRIIDVDATSIAKVNQFKKFNQYIKNKIKIHQKTTSKKSPAFLFRKLT